LEKHTPSSSGTISKGSKEPARKRQKTDICPEDLGSTFSEMFGGTSTTLYGVISQIAILIQIIKDKQQI
jgi:hypothetical protein